MRSSKSQKIEFIKIDSHKSNNVFYNNSRKKWKNVVDRIAERAPKVLERSGFFFKEGQTLEIKSDLVCAKQI